MIQLGMADSKHPVDGLRKGFGLNLCKTQILK